MQAVWPLVAPPAHARHAAWPVAPWNMPDGQSKHEAIAAASAYLPAAQSTQVLPTLRCLPATHSEQKVWPAFGWYLPLGHGVHSWALVIG